MKLLTSIKKTVGLAFSGIFISMLVFALPATAIPYNGDDTVGLDYPAFNVFTGTPSAGDEPDFLRGKEETNSGASTDVVNSACANGTRFVLRVYVHNGAKDTLNDNGNGPGVAKGTKVRVALPSQTTASSFGINGVISASNATTVSDGMTINCGGKTVTMNYVPGSAKQFTALSGTQAVSDSIVTSGAPIGTYGPNGDVWGCWNQRVYVTLVVEVKSAPTPPPPVTSTGVCKAVDVQTSDNRTVKVTVHGQVDNATIVGYKTDFGDGTTSNKQTDTHTYAKDGTYKIVSSVLVKFADGHTEWKTADACTKIVKFKSNVPPEVIVVNKTTPPTVVTTTGTLPATGAGGVIAIATATSTLGALGYRRYLSRKNAEV